MLLSRRRSRGCGWGCWTILFEVCGGGFAVCWFLRLAFHGGFLLSPPLQGEGWVGMVFGCARALHAFVIPAIASPSRHPGERFPTSSSWRRLLNLVIPAKAGIQLFAFAFDLL